MVLLLLLPPVLPQHWVPQLLLCLCWQPPSRCQPAAGALEHDAQSGRCRPALSEVEAIPLDPSPAALLPLLPHRHHHQVPLAAAVAWQSCAQVHHGYDIPVEDGNTMIYGQIYGLLMLDTSMERRA